METPLEPDPAGPVVAEPGLRSVEVAVDRRAEALVELEHQRCVEAPHTGRSAGHARRVPAPRPWARQERRHARIVAGGLLLVNPYARGRWLRRRPSTA